MLLLRFDHSDNEEARIEHVVGAPRLLAVVGGPLGDGEVPPLRRPHAALVGELLGVRLPPGRAELRVDELARRGLVELDRVARLGGAGHRLLDLRRGRGGGSGLERGELGGELVVLLLEGLALRGLLALVLDLFVGERLPNGGVVSGLGRALLGAESLLRLPLGGDSDLVDGAGRLLRLAGALREIGAQPRELVMEERVGLLRLRGRDERPRVELAVVPERALKPHGELARHAELMERLPRLASPLVHCGVAHAPEIVKQRALRRPDDVAVEQSVDQRLLRLPRVREQRDLCRRALREDLGEEPQLGERDRRIAREVLLRLRRQRHEPCVVMRKEREVRRGVQVGTSHSDRSFEGIRSGSAPGD